LRGEGCRARGVRACLKPFFRADERSIHLLTNKTVNAPPCNDLSVGWSEALAAIHSCGRIFSHLLNVLRRPPRAGAAPAAS
jgi:hypothetical protein